MRSVLPAPACPRLPPPVLRWVQAGAGSALLLPQRSPAPTPPAALLCGWLPTRGVSPGALLHRLHLVLPTGVSPLCCGWGLCAATEWGD